MMAGSLVRWNPPDLSRIFCEDTAISFAEQIPLPGILSRVDGRIGRMSLMQRNGKKGEIAVLLSELIPCGGGLNAEQ